MSNINQILNRFRDESIVKPWTQLEKLLFRFVFIYFVLQAIPLDWKFYAQLFSFDFSLAGLFNLAHYSPAILGQSQTYFDWFVFAAFAGIGTYFWTKYDTESKSYHVLFYWLRAALRVRLSIALLVYAFIKIFPLQFPYPSLSQLNTRYGDFSLWKVYSLGLGIVPNYVVFLGLIELLFAVLLLYRKTASLAAFGAIVFLGNIFFADFAYEGAENVYALYLISLAFIVFIYDINRFVSLFGNVQTTLPDAFKFDFADRNVTNLRFALKSLVVVFVLVYGVQSFGSFKKGGYHFPSKLGLKKSAGLYNVSLFIINKDTIKYSQTDDKRWNNVVFEKWNTISIKTNKNVPLDDVNIEKVSLPQNERTYENEGTIGRNYYSYEFDTTKQTIVLKSKSKFDFGEPIQLSYQRPTDSTFVLSGKLNSNDSVYVLLEKINKRYLLKEVKKTGRGKTIKL